LTNAPGGPYEEADYTNFNGTWTCTYMNIRSVPYAYFWWGGAPPPGCLWYKVINYVYDSIGNVIRQDVIFILPGLRDAAIYVVRLVSGFSSNLGIWTSTTVDKILLNNNVILNGTLDTTSFIGTGVDTQANFNMTISLIPGIILPAARGCNHICYTGLNTSTGMVEAPTLSDTMYITVDALVNIPDTLYGSFAMNYVIKDDLWRSVIPDIPTSGSFCLYYFEFRCNKFSYLFTIWEASDFNPIWHIINGPTVISPTGFFPLFLHTNITFASVCGNLSPDQFAEVHITS
jgi:hypothetical protein